jgi:hypothetical protein
VRHHDDHVQGRGLAKTAQGEERGDGGVTCAVEGVMCILLLYLNTGMKKSFNQYGTDPWIQEEGVKGNVSIPTSACRIDDDMMTHAECAHIKELQEIPVCGACLRCSLRCFRSHW